MPGQPKVSINDGAKLVYSQSKGCIFLEDDKGQQCMIGTGYSGHGIHVNVPNAEGLKAQGPIPRGLWDIVAIANHPEKGPTTIRLTPNGHSAYGRSGFLIHGDNTGGDLSASLGCIIAAKPVREAIKALGLKLLKVIL